MKILGISLLRVIILTLSCIVLFGCTADPIYHQANQNTDALQKQVTNLDYYTTLPKKVSTVDQTYVDQTPFVMLPKWMQKKVELKGAIPFKQAIMLLTQDNDISVFYADDVNANKIIKINYSGEIVNVLKLLQKKSNYHYTIHGNLLSWSNQVTKTFQVDIMPGDNSFDLGKGQTSLNGISTGSDSSNTNSKSNADFSNLVGNLSIWNDINKELPHLLSKTGKFTVSEASSSVTVTDQWENISKVEKWIDNLNESLGQQVSIRVEILQVKLNKQFERGINWQLAMDKISMNNPLGPNLFSKLTLGTLSSDNSGATFSGTINAGGLKGSSLFIMALSEQGKVSVKNSPVITTLNNQVAEIQQVVNTGYLKEMSVTSSSTTSTNTTPEVSLTPGNVTTGLQLYVLPKIKGSKIYLQISANLSTLADLKSYTANQQDSSNSDKVQPLVASSIQLPVIENKKFNQRSLLKNGQTLVIAGFNETQNSTKNVKYMNLPITGGASGLSDKTETVLLITPHVVRQ